MKIVLHALVLGRSVFRDDLADLLANHDAPTVDRDQAVRNALTKLRNLSLDIPPEENPVFLSPSQPMASIDLWEFFAHVRSGRYLEASRLIADGQEPYLLLGAPDPERDTWKATFAEFHEAREKVIAAMEATSGRRHSMLATREWLLARSLTPGVGQAVPIRKVRERLERFEVPWTEERPEETEGQSPITDHLAGILTREGTIPNQIVLVGGPGSGKTLTAISTFLRLTDNLEDDITSPDVRTVLYVDPESEGSQAGFGEDAWLERRLQDVGAEDAGRPIVIMPHGDAFLSRNQYELKAVLDSRVFRDADILVCCGSQLFLRRLCYEQFGTHVVRLDPWSVKLQKSFAEALAGGSKRREFEDWLKQDQTRRQLCGVPLHLVHVLSLLGENAEALAEISTPAQLFDGVARMRLRVAGNSFDEDQMMQDLASLAHRFYADATPADAPIRFSPEELKQHLRKRKRSKIARRADTMINDTLLTVSPPGSDTLRFEDLSWGWFFVSWHMVRTILNKPNETLEAFAKLLSANMACLCEEMLVERRDLYKSQIYASLRFALHGEVGRGVDPTRLTIARAQVAYLLGVLGDQQVRRELAPLVQPDSSDLERDNLVRRGIVLGLADGGAAKFADAYVEALRRERESGGPAPERDANIGFLLSSRGDQSFDPESPGRISSGVDPIHTVGDLILGLESARYQGSWRLKLFTLVDLGAHPAISKAGFAAAIELFDNRLAAIHARLQRDRSKNKWPEVSELGQLLASPGRKSRSSSR